MWRLAVVSAASTARLLVRRGDPTISSRLSLVTLVQTNSVPTVSLFSG